MAAQGIFSGGTLGSLKDYQAPPAGGSVTKFHFSKDSKYLKKNSFFKNVNIFLPQKIHFFDEKFMKIEYILHEFLIFFRKNISVPKV